MKRAIFLVCVISCILIFVAGNMAFGTDFVPGGFFLDDFEDGNSRDSNPARWVRGVWNAEDDEVINGDLNILGARGPSVLGPRTPGPRRDKWLTYDDAIIRTQVRITNPSEEVSIVGLFSRSRSPAVYLAFVTTQGEMVIQESFSNGSSVDLQRLQVGLDPVAGDVLLELRNVGSRISLTAWAEGQPKPATPQISVTDDTLPDGTFGPYFWTDGTPGDAAFRWIEVAPIPEPSTAILATLLSICVVGTRRMRKKDSPC